MIPHQLTDVVFALPEQERLDLAWKIINGIAMEQQTGELIQSGVKRLEDVVSGEITALSEEGFALATK